MSEVIADYRGFDYQKEFWEKGGRSYEDACDRIALRKLLKKHGDRLVDVCGGYGRLVNEYLPKYAEVIVFDYAQNLLDQAAARYGDKITTQQGTADELPFETASIDTCIFVRASHHFAELEKIIAQISRILKTGGEAVVEIANKKHFLQIVRHLLKRSPYDPFAQETISRNQKGFFNYHPAYIEALFKKEGLAVADKLSVSNFRNGLFKKILGLKFLCALEKILQRPLAKIEFGPSIYYLVKKEQAEADRLFGN